MVCVHMMWSCVYLTKMIMTEYLDSSRQSLEASEMNVRHAVNKTHWIYEGSSKRKGRHF